MFEGLSICRSLSRLSGFASIFSVGWQFYCKMSARGTFQEVILRKKILVKLGPFCLMPVGVLSREEYSFYMLSSDKTKL